MSKKFTLTFAGDTSLGNYYIGKLNNKKVTERLENNPFSFFEGVAPLVKESDHFILNFESVLVDNPTNSIAGKEYPNWDSPERTLKVLKELGVTAVSLANNHAMDFGQETLLETKEKLKSAGIDTFGANKSEKRACEPLKIKLKGSKDKKNVYILTGMRAGKRYRDEYEFFAKDNKPGVGSLSQKKMSKKISKIREKDSDALIIVYPHWQGQDYKWASEHERIRERSRSFIDAGADLVIGHGPHMANDIELYKNGTIAYSIGNFVFNSPGRYTKMDAPPYSFVVKLVITENKGNWSYEPQFYPIITDNKRTGFNSKQVLKKEHTELKGILDDRARMLKNKVLYKADKDKLGFFYNVESINDGPKKKETSLNKMDVLDIIYGKKNISDVNFDDEATLQNQIEQLNEIHNLIDLRFNEYYSKLTNSNKLKKKSPDNYSYYESLSKSIKRDYITYPIMRQFTQRKLNMRNAISFKDIVVQKTESRRIGNTDYGRMLDKKNVAYEFADKINLRRPHTHPRTYKFSEIEPQTGPVVIKPTKATGSMGVYLIYNQSKILSARDGIYLNSWSELVKDVTKKMDEDAKRVRKYFKKDEWMIEELVLGSGGKPAPDIKFYTFYGEVLLVSESTPDQRKKFCYWDANMNLANTGRYEENFYQGSGFTQEDLDIAVSASLKIPTPFMRLDMLKGENGLVFGEATYYPGNFHSFNHKWDRRLGEAYVNAEARLFRDLLNGKKFDEFTRLFPI